MTASENAVPEKPAMRGRSRKWKRVVRGLLVFGLIWFLGDWGYSQYVQWRITRWTESVPWDANGLEPGSQEVEIGAGPVALLCVHGFSDSPQMYRKLAPAWADRGYRCR
ncbi:MAG: hypothetical protein AAGG44_07370, partial [Planctomycetota bacterium]